MEIRKRVQDAVIGPGTKQQIDDLETRVAALEAELVEARRHHLRLAELTDLVQELLIPISMRDEDKVTELVTKFTDQLT